MRLLQEYALPLDLASVAVRMRCCHRLGRAGRRLAGPPSFAFPENATPELAPAGWRPAYPDYLYLAYTNATAFSPTDTLPVRRWTKLTMMVQSTLSLVIEILALALARASNVLPG